jgi:hypothetical protein
MINAASECLSKSPRVERLILIISIVKENRMNNPMTPLEELFRDVKLCEKIRRKLPFLFALAEQKVSRAGKAGMEVGTLREQILIALLIYKFGEARVDLDIPITEHEIDVRVSGYPLSIKTVTAGSRKAPTVKISWTVDWDKVTNLSKITNQNVICCWLSSAGKEQGVFTAYLCRRKEMCLNTLARRDT